MPGTRLIRGPAKGRTRVPNMIRGHFFTGAAGLSAEFGGAGGAG
jgi:hypothetical protein